MAARQSRSRLTAIIAGVVAFVVFLGLPFLTWLSGVWVDWAWFSDMGQRQVFVTRITSQIAVGVVFAVLSFLILYTSMRVARRMAPRAVPIGMPEGTPEQLEMFVEQLRGKMGPILDKAILFGALILAFFNGAEMSANWQTFRLALASVPFGYTDPQFGRDVGFFVFQLPAFNAICGWLTAKSANGSRRRP